MKWYVKIALWIVRRHCPEQVDDRTSLLASMRRMGDKIMLLKKEREEWRQRCFSAEKVVGYEMAEAFRAGVKRHNHEHGSCIYL